MYITLTIWVQYPTLLHHFYIDSTKCLSYLDKFLSTNYVWTMWREWICILRIFSSCLWTRKEYNPSSEKCSVYDLVTYFNLYTPRVMYFNSSRVNLGKSGKHFSVIGSHDALFFYHPFSARFCSLLGCEASNNILLVTKWSSGFLWVLGDPMALQNAQTILM